jgi:hypothetical protein
MHPTHASEVITRLWWPWSHWLLALRGVTINTYHMRCGRCGHNGRIHLLGCGCRRFVRPVPVRDDAP